MSILFINACVREHSRTLTLARYCLAKMGGVVQELELQKENIAPLNQTTLALRERLLRENALSHEAFCYARDFAKAEEIVIAAPFWDLSFPSLLKTYLEAVTVSGITFHYLDNVPHGLCRAKRLIYITTAGGLIFADFGFSYVKTLAQNFYGIQAVTCFQAEGLDLEGANPQALLDAAKQRILNSELLEKSM